MKIDFSKLNFSFSEKPLLIGGKAMEYHGLRKSGKDIDFVVCRKDLEALVKKYPQNLKDLWGDFGVAVFEFEIWKTINYFDYDYLKENAIEETNHLVISLGKLLFQKAMVIEKAKYRRDLEMIVKKIQSVQAEKYEQIKQENQQIINSLSNIKYVERKGPEN